MRTLPFMSFPQCIIKPFDPELQPRTPPFRHVDQGMSPEFVRLLLIGPEPILFESQEVLGRSQNLTGGIANSLPLLVRRSPVRKLRRAARNASPRPS